MSRGLLAPGRLPGEPILVLERPRYAAWSRRFVAFLLDSLILSAVAALTFGPDNSVSGLPFISVSSDDPIEWSGGLPSWLLLVVTLALLVSQSYFGSTPGKRVVGIAVVDSETGRPAGLLTNILRWLAHFLDSILMIGYLRPLWHPQKRTFADSLLSTVVVERRRRTGARTTLAAFAVCVVALVIILGPRGVTPSGAVTMCEVETELDAEADATGFSDAALELNYAAPRTETFWGITYTGQSEQHLDLRWLWDADAELISSRTPQNITATVTIHSASGGEQNLTTVLVPRADVADGQLENPDAGIEDFSTSADLAPDGVLRVPGHMITSLGEGGWVESELVFGQQRIASATCR